MNKKQIETELLTTYWTADRLGEDTEDEEVLQVLGQIQVATQNGLLAVLQEDWEQAESIRKTSSVFLARMEAVIELLMYDDMDLN